MTILFDASIHFGQFNPRDEAMRIACKNSQVAIATKPGGAIRALAPFNENSWVDHVIWDLGRHEQDLFYPFMDVFHSVKVIDRIPLTAEDSRRAIEIHDRFKLDISNALSCAISIREHVDEVHTFYPSLLESDIVAHMRGYGVLVKQPPYSDEIVFAEPGLEDHYQKALTMCRAKGLDLVSKLHI